jgi:hypothetical protein
MSTLRAGVLAVAAATAVVLAGLTIPAPASAAATVGSCYAYRAATLKAISSTAPVVDCNAQHTAETYYAGTLPETFGLPSKAPRAKLLSAGQPCTVAAMNSYLGVPDRQLPSRFLTVVLFPTDDEWTAGERWFRCDVVLQGGLQLKSFTGTVAALVAATPADQFNFCTPREPNARATAAFPCLTPKRNWLKVLDQELGGPGSSFPGTSSVERKTRALCEKQGKKWSGRQKYPGWWAIWPTSVGWKQGKRSAQCFVPYSQYLKQVALQTRPVPAPTPTPTATPDPAPPASAAPSTP